MAKKINKIFANRKAVASIVIALICLGLVGVLILWNINKPKEETPAPSTNNSSSIEGSSDVMSTMQPADPQDPDTSLAIPTSN